ncbi:MAG TPA: DUF3014 domain-containing protein [Ramlibacter sp.]|jgi:hypothetical protein|uniref:DUF3014 domain-containing protein n=1 Tax=Ramlibacter sp. TaxID=1917967 RepID=UPI002D425B26|nr:DUF3014 domain-containing protein [Ramlibacter sp.]HZY19878.1 DUF3014 domain-containing protein [Ramlibacter sp.]
MTLHDDFRADPREDPAPRARPADTGLRWALALLIALGLAGAWWMFARGPAPEWPRPGPAAPAAAAAADPTSPVAAPEPPPPVAEGGALAASQVPSALEALLGREAIARFVVLDDFPRRLVATVDNLGRAHAPPSAWPLHKAGGRFETTTSGGATVAAPENARRHAALVTLAEAVDVPAAARLYARLYPLLQKAWGDLGLGRREFHGRLLEVIDLLLATPEPASPPALQLTPVKGDVPSTQPWTRYEFADPALEALPAGQKALLRTGLSNERRLKAVLRQLRRELLPAPEGGSQRP